MRRDDISELTGSIWRDTLGLEVEEEEPRKPRKGDSKIVGVIKVASESFRGTVKLECSPEVARRAASIMFEKPEGEATAGDIEDAIGELTNMTGGNFKALVPGSARLSLPKVAEVDSCEPAPAGESTQVGFRVTNGDSDEDFVVTVTDETPQ